MDNIFNNFTVYFYGYDFSYSHICINIQFIYSISLIMNFKVLNFFIFEVSLDFYHGKNVVIVLQWRITLYLPL